MKNKQERLIAYKQVLQYYKDCIANGIKPSKGICCALLTPNKEGTGYIYKFDIDVSCREHIPEIWKWRTCASDDPGGNMSFWFNNDTERMIVLEGVINEMENSPLGILVRLRQALLDNPTWGCGLNGPSWGPRGLCMIAYHLGVSYAVWEKTAHLIKTVSPRPWGIYWFNNREERLEALNTLINQLDI